VRTIGEALVLTPTIANIAAADAAAASALSNMSRNLGGAVGTDSLGTILTKRAHRPDRRLFHGAWHLGPCRCHPEGHCHAWPRRSPPGPILGFSDTFAVIGVVLAVAAIASLLTRKTTV